MDGTVMSFNTLNYSGLLYNKANTNTPFLNAISGKVRYTQSVEFVTGQEYSSEEGDIPAISEKASLKAPTATSTTRSQKTNVTQIFQESVSISYAKMSNMNTLSGINIAGQTPNPTNEFDFQVANKFLKIKRSIEKAFIQGKYNKATSDDEINKTRGMDEAITTNVIEAGEKPLDIWLVNDLLVKIKASQGDISNLVLWVDTTSLNQINGNAVEYGMKLGDAYMSAFGIQVRDLILPIGTIHIALGEFIPEGTVYAFNFSVIGPVEQPTPGKGNFFYEPLSKEGAGERGQIFGQIGLDHGPEWFHGKITGLSTEFTKPVGQKVVTVTELPKPAQKTVTINLPEGEVLGIDVSTLQEVELNDTKVTGTSKYVESFPKFSKSAKGNFLAIKCDEATKGETINWELSEAKTKGSGTLDEDGILVVQLHSNTQKITLKNDETSKVLDLTGLTLSPSE